MRVFYTFINQYSEWFIIGFIILAYCIGEIFFSLKKKKLKTAMDKEYHSEQYSGESSEQEDNLEYYKYKNILSFLRFGILFLIFNIYIVYKLPNFFSFFSIAVGAIIITFKELILCFFGFFYILTQYKVGDSVIILEGGTNLRGEIIYINILNVGMVGKDINGEHNGQFYRIPNAKFLTEIIKREEIGLHKYKKEEIKIIYSKAIFGISLDDFIVKISEHLNQVLPKRTINNVGNYKTFIGFRYKMRFVYNDEKNENIIVLKISFIEKPKHIFNIEKGLFSFIEELKIDEKTQKNEESKDEKN